MTIRLTFAACLSLAVAACDSGAPPAPRPSPAPTPTAAPSPTPLAALPEAVQGKWGTSAADCAGTGALRMTIGATTMTFATSTAKVRDIVQVRPTDWTATLNYTNRMGKWSAGTELTLQDGGKALKKHDDHPSATTIYTRCPA